MRAIGITEYDSGFYSNNIIYLTENFFVHGMLICGHFTYMTDELADI